MARACGNGARTECNYYDWIRAHTRSLRGRQRSRSFADRENTGRVQGASGNGDVGAHERASVRASPSARAPGVLHPCVGRSVSLMALRTGACKSYPVGCCLARWLLPCALRAREGAESHARARSRRRDGRLEFSRRDTIRLTVTQISRTSGVYDSILMRNSKWEIKLNSQARLSHARGTERDKSAHRTAHIPRRDAGPRRRSPSVSHTHTRPAGANRTLITTHGRLPLGRTRCSCVSLRWMQRHIGGHGVVRGRPQGHRKMPSSRHVRPDRRRRSAPCP